METNTALKPNKSADKRLFSTPFSADYWRAAASELKKPRMLVLAALIIALRVALKSIAIPVGESLNIYMTFFVNAMGSMIYGPVVGLLGGAISDTLGALLFPSGTYFFPFIITEMLGSFLYALFLYRTRLSAWRIILSKFSVTLICNIMLTPIIMYYYNLMLFDKPYKILSLPRIIKNAALFPFESVLLVFFLGIMQPILLRLGYLGADNKFTAKLTAKNVVLIVLLTLVSVGIIVCYYFFYLKK